MDNKISTYSPAFSIVSWIALVGGIVTYLLGLWNAEMQLNERVLFCRTGVRTVFCCVLSKDRSGQV
ncbi:YiaA/YiaB family inner membrane protein [Shigella flexneri]